MAGLVVFDECRTQLFSGDLDWVNDNIRMVFADTFTYSRQTQRFFSDLPAVFGESGGTTRASGKLLTGKSVANGQLRASNVLGYLDPSAGGISVDVILLYKDTGSDVTSPLICAIDSVTDSGIPFDATLGNDFDLIFDTADNIVVTADLTGGGNTFIYDKGIQYILEGNLVWATDTIRCIFVDAASYSPSRTSHQFFSDLSGTRGSGSGGSRTDGPLILGKTTSNGFARADPTKFVAVTGSTTYEYIVVYKDTGVDGTSPLLCIMDAGSGLPFTADGGDVVINWNPDVMRFQN